jgi:hypothetical protein
VLATGTKGLWFKPGQGDEFLMVIKIHSTFGWEVQLDAPCYQILRHVRDPLTYQRYQYTKFSLLHPFLAQINLGDEEQARWWLRF